MARDVVTIQTISETAGLSAVFTAFVTANGATFVNTNQNANMMFRNGEAVAKTITISTDKTVSDQSAAITSKTFTLAASAVLLIIPSLENQFWAQAGTSNIHVDIDVDTAVTWAVVAPA